MVWMIIRFVCFLPLHIIGKLLAWPLVPVAVIFADREGRLPYIVRWLETHDNVGWSGPLSEPATAAVVERWGQRAGLCRWLWRNRAYRLRYMMGIPLHHKDVDWSVLRTTGSYEAPRRGWSFSYVEVEANGLRFFEFQPGYSFGVIRVWRWTSKEFRLYLRIGWKVKAMSRGRTRGSIGMFTGITPRSDDWDD
ncbi:hypothetical protein RA27_02390 [Ruegeria sp. ANG-R]|uniref:DUF7338 family protein n=1 Tax=Ruegeria sp. ANG-R TaxID=1577903 RepID=UPI00057E35D4|nr:hypothetical protein [Ruegeria sp. ANG-R]KIC42253.1 hypothetical protein RA27_02390 [Ruegeria sp. ANG-R]